MSERKVKSICVISQGYPSEKQPWFPFVDQLLCAMAVQGVKCTVISPQSVSKKALRSTEDRPLHWKREYKGQTIDIYQPKYVSFSNLHVGKYYFTDLSFERQAIKCFEGLGQKFDVVYGHFWQCGLVAAKIGKRHNIPAFMACGESVIPYEKLQHNLKYKDNLAGVICVSTKSRNESVSLDLCDAEKTIICPNAIDTELFFAKDKLQCRQALGIPEEYFITAFVGAFSHRKGSKRLSKALEKVDGAYSIFIGSGEENPDCERRLFTGALPHEKIAQYLCAADVFVLPTLNEGCCNAIIEAMACGLPVISSALPFNDDILNDECAILIDPNQVDDIESAIRTMQENTQLRNQMRAAALHMAASLTIDKRAERILAFMGEKC